MIRRIQRDDRGAALVLVLVVITILALGLSALLTLSDASIRATVGLRDQAASTYNADGATQAAVNNIRNSTFNGATGTNCFGGSDTLSLPGFYGADSAAVVCSPDPAKVAIRCISESQCNRPGNAILTLGQIPGEDGLHIDQPNSGSTFRVRGRIFSNSNINVTSGVLNSNTRVYARGSCSGTIQSTPQAACNYGSTPNDFGNDPGYQPAATIASIPYRSLPACTTPNSVVTFLPGYYDDAKGLSDMMAGNSACKHSTWWFKPGPYYFDFHNSGTNPNPLLNSNGGNVWTIDDGYLVAGTPINAAGAEIAAPPVAPTIPGACHNPIDPTNATSTLPGVQFIFGGDSQFVLKAAKAEICGTYDPNKPPVAIYGLSSGSETTTSLTGANNLKLDTVTAAGAFTGATPTSLRAVDGISASWKAAAANDTTTLTATGFQPPSAIPAGSILQSATLKITHRHDDASSTDSFSNVTVARPDGTLPLTVSSVSGRPGNASFQTTSIPLDTARTGNLAKSVRAGFTGANVSLTAKLPKKDDLEYIDAVQLELTYTAPAFRAPSGCITAGPYTGGGSTSCAVVTSVNTSGNLFYVQGTTYAPKAVLDITLNNAVEQVFRFGVIARSVWVKLTGSFNFGGAVIEVPDDTPGFVFSVYLTTYICPSSSTCGTSGTPVLRSRAAFIDDNPANPIAGQRQVAVLSWSKPG